MNKHMHGRVKKIWKYNNVNFKKEDIVSFAGLRTDMIVTNRNNTEIEQSNSSKNDFSTITIVKSRQSLKKTWMDTHVIMIAIRAFQIGFNRYTCVQVIKRTTIRKIVTVLIIDLCLLCCCLNDK